MFLGDFLHGPEGPKNPRRSRPQEPKMGFEERLWRFFMWYEKLPKYARKMLFVLYLGLAFLWAGYVLKK